MVVMSLDSKRLIGVYSQGRAPVTTMSTRRVPRLVNVRRRLVVARTVVTEVANTSGGGVTQA